MWKNGLLSWAPWISLYRSKEPQKRGHPVACADDGSTCPFLPALFHLQDPRIRPARFCSQNHSKLTPPIVSLQTGICNSKNCACDQQKKSRRYQVVVMREAPVFEKLPLLHVSTTKLRLVTVASLQQARLVSLCIRGLTAKIVFRTCLRTCMLHDCFSLVLPCSLYTLFAPVACVTRGTYAKPGQVKAIASSFQMKSLDKNMWLHLSLHSLYMENVQWVADHIIFSTCLHCHGQFAWGIFYGKHPQKGQCWQCRVRVTLLVPTTLCTSV